MKYVKDLKHIEPSARNANSLKLIFGSSRFKHKGFILLLLKNKRRTKTILYINSGNFLKERNFEIYVILLNLFSTAHISHVVSRGVSV